MAWFRNHYHCDDCGNEWEDDWSCCCDDQCPECGSKNWSPYDSDDLTFLVEHDEGQYVISMSPRSAEHTPDYDEIALAPTLGGAETYVKLRQSSYWD